MEELKKEPQESLCIMGDTNCMLDNIDRSPAHTDDKKVTDQLRKMISRYKLLDSWRIQNPDKREFTFDQRGSGAAARIDRMYLSRELHKVAYETTIESNFELSNHSLIITKVIENNLPYCGKGMWKLRESTIAMGDFQKETGKILKEFKKWADDYEHFEELFDKETEKLKEKWKKGTTRKQNGRK